MGNQIRFEPEVVACLNASLFSIKDGQLVSAQLIDGELVMWPCGEPPPSPRDVQLAKQDHEQQ